MKAILLPLLNKVLKYLYDVRLLSVLPKAQSLRLIKYINKSRSQFGQDFFVLSELGFKQNGFFVEFGATNGIDLSNTYLLEKHFGWTGILAEPAICWHEDLHTNRTCQIETKCVWNSSGETLMFTETESAEFSTIKSFSSSDMHSGIRQHSTTYAVETISLTDMLESFGAPGDIDFLSIDTEGSEYDILKGVDFEKYRFRIISCEHNYTADRELVYRLLRNKGYKRKLKNISRVDDWFVAQ